MIRASSVALVGVALHGTAYAEHEGDITSPSSARAPEFLGHDSLIGAWGRRAALETAGVTLTGTYAIEGFAMPSLPDRFVVGGLLVIGADFDLATLVNERLGAVHVAGLAIHGDGPTSQLMDIYGISGNTAPEDVRLFEAWIEQPMKAFTLRAGLLSADQEYLISTQSTVLINATFGITSQLSYNVIGPVYPQAAPGVSARVETEPVTVRAAIYDGEQHDSRGIPRGRPGTYLAIAEVELAQIVKLGAWRHSTTDGNAIYALFDAQLTDRVGTFARVGYSPAEPVATYIDAGIRIGPGPLRAKDFIGLGTAFARTERGAEIVFEATYQLQFRWLTIQPDIQVLLQPDRTTLIFATRATMVL